MSVQTIDAASTESHSRVSVTIDGIDAGLFDEFDGAHGGSEITKHRPAGSTTMRNTLPGIITYDDATLTRGYVNSRDAALYSRLIGRQGRAVVLISEQDLDGDNNPINRPHTYRGTVQKVSKPKSSSASAALRQLVLNVSVESVA